MLARICGRRCCAWLSLAVGLIQPLQNTCATQPQRKFVDTELTFTAGRAPTDSGNFSTWMDYAEKLEGKLTAFGAFALPHRETGRRGDPGISFPPMVEGNIVPVAGHLYRVRKIFDIGLAKGTQGRDSMVMEWLNPKDAPDMLSVQTESFVIPLRGKDSNGGASKHGTSFWVDRIEDADQPPIATVGILGGISINAPKPQERARVRKGHILLVGDEGFQVLNVVPQNAKTGAIGWVELDSSPIPEVELKKHKSVVRPMSTR